MKNIEKFTEIKQDELSEIIGGSAYSDGYKVGHGLGIAGGIGQAVWTVVKWLR